MRQQSKFMEAKKCIAKFFICCKKNDSLMCTKALITMLSNTRQHQRINLSSSGRFSRGIFFLILQILWIIMKINSMLDSNKEDSIEKNHFIIPFFCSRISPYIWTTITSSYYFCFLYSLIKENLWFLFATCYKLVFKIFFFSTENKQK